MPEWDQALCITWIATLWREGSGVRAVAGAANSLSTAAKRGKARLLTLSADQSPPPAASAARPQPIASKAKH
ncbi:unnamed protein product, partial [Iphiclides podalirius]